MQGFIQFRLGCHGLPIAVGRLSGAGQLIGLTGCACLATVVLLVMKNTLFLNVLPLLLRDSGMRTFSRLELTMRSFFAQPDHIGVLRYVLDCLDFMKT